MWSNTMDNFYDFNEDFDGTTGTFRQQTMQQPTDSGVSASVPLTSAPSAVSSAVVSSSALRIWDQTKQTCLFLAIIAD